MMRRKSSKHPTHRRRIGIKANASRAQFEPAHTRYQNECMQYQIKKLRKEDLSLAQELFILFKKVFDEVDVETTNLPDEIYLSNLLRKDSFHVFAALTEGRVVGGLTAYEFDMYMKKERE